MSEPFREPPDDLADTFPWLPRGLYKRVKSDKGLARNIGIDAEIIADAMAEVTKIELRRVARNEQSDAR